MANLRKAALKKEAINILKLTGTVTIVFNTKEVKTVNNPVSLNRQFELSEYFDGIKEVK